MSLRIGLSLAVAAIAVSAGSAHAVFQLANGQSVSLADVISSTDHKFQVGDKIFTVQTYTSPTFNPASVSVTGFIAANPLSGIGFDLTAGWGDRPGDLAISEFNISYTVEIDPVAYAQGYRIVDTGLTFNGSASGTGSYARVDESIFNFFGQPGQNLLGTRQAFAIAGPPPVTQLQDFQVLPGTGGYQKLEVNKDVQFFANGPNGSAAASFVRQSFSQIPTPGGSLLALIGGVMIVRRRR